MTTTPSFFEQSDILGQASVAVTAAQASATTAQAAATTAQSAQAAAQTAAQTAQAAAATAQSIASTVTPGSSQSTGTGTVSVTLDSVKNVLGQGTTAKANLGLADVAASGSYADLSNKPTIPVVPTFATVAQTGLYADLGGTPATVSPSVLTKGTVTSTTNLVVYDANDNDSRVGPDDLATYTAAKLSAFSTVPFAASITPNFSTSPNEDVATLTGNITINNPSANPADGVMVRIRLPQDATGGRTATWGNAYKGVKTLSTAGGKVDCYVAYFRAASGTYEGGVVQDVGS